MRTIVLASALSVCVWSAALAEDVQIHRLEITPAGRPVPTMRYRLLPAARELKPGNATDQEYRAMLEMKNRDRPGDHNKINDWLDLPADQFPRAEAAEMLSRYAGPLRDLARAARRERSAWDIPLREEGVETLLDELQWARSFARMLALKIRLEIVERDFAAASQTLATSIALARHIGESATVIGSLVGISITGAAANEIREWIGTPGSPNLYWALTALPDPPVTIRTGLQSEELCVVAAFPHLDLLDTAILSRQQADELWAAAGKLIDLTNLPSSERPLSIVGPTHGTTPLLLPSLWIYPHAKKYLLGTGRKAETVEAMPVAQAIVLAWIDVHRSYLDEMMVWVDKPYPEAEKALTEIDKLASRPAEAPERILASILLPSAKNVYQAEVRGAQQIAALRTIEALRLYAASHNGQLPTKLADVVEVPVPRDPATDQPFDYQLQDKTAILRPKSLTFPVQYEITVRSAK